jgi:hypothetical protein
METALTFLGWSAGIYYGIMSVTALLGLIGAFLNKR